MKQTTWHEKIIRFYDYWFSLNNGNVPTRSQFDPLQIHDLMPNLWMVDIVGPPYRYYFRLMGSQHDEIIGYSLTGKFLDEVYDGDGVEDYHQLAESKMPSYRKGFAHYHVGDHRMIERLMLPMYDDKRNQDMIIALTLYVKD